MVDSRFEFSKITVLESLADGERKTGRELAHTIKLELLARSETQPVEYNPVPGCEEFIAALERLEREADAGHIPMLHIECHGDRESGLHFADGTSMPWEELAERLLRINIRTRFNLFVLVSACFGAYFLGMLSAIRPCPCWGIVAPTEAVYPDELENGFGEFYRALFTTWDAGEATAVLKERSLQHGHWLSEVSERWFGRIFLNYLRTHCTAAATGERLRELRARQEQEGLPWMSLRDLRYQLRLANARALDKYFAVYFQTEAIPEAASRFASLRTALEEEARSLAFGGDYLI